MTGMNSDAMEDILIRAKNYCLSLLEKSRCASLSFHNAGHTLEVYENVKCIGSYEGLSKGELEPILLAAFFHDVGNAWTFQGHEDQSGSEAKKFLGRWGYPEPKLDVVLQCIQATRLPQNPQNVQGQILCDADLFHLGTTSFMAKNQRLRTEWEQYRKIRYTEKEWLELNISFLGEQSYFTRYGKEILEPVKQSNLQLLQQKLQSY